jgi:dTDP-4-amino-4,6-dideoxy-D-galactose acyltransferase
MSCQIKILNWDTNFFGYRIASVNAQNMTRSDLKNIIKQLKSENFRLAYCFVDPGDLVSNSSMKETSVFLADEKVTFHRSLKDRTTSGSIENIEPYKLNFVTDKLKLLALQSGEYSRFRLDPQLKNGEFEKLYTEWIEKSVSKAISDEILIFSDNNSLDGFITLSVRGQVGSIGLVAVDEEVRGKSIGKKLLSASFGYFADKGADRAEVVTQLGNAGACGFYKSCGFEIKNIVNIYHLWIK